MPLGDSVSNDSRLYVGYQKNRIVSFAHCWKLIRLLRIVKIGRCNSFQVFSGYSFWFLAGIGGHRFRPPDKCACQNFFFLFLSQNICCGYSKEPFRFILQVWLRKKDRAP